MFRGLFSARTRIVHVLKTSRVAHHLYVKTCTCCQKAQVVFPIFGAFKYFTVSGTADTGHDSRALSSDSAKNRLSNMTTASRNGHLTLPPHLLISFSSPIRHCTFILWRKTMQARVTFAACILDTTRYVIDIRTDKSHTYGTNYTFPSGLMDSKNCKSMRKRPTWCTN